MGADVLIIKMAYGRDPPELLHTEAVWAQYLSKLSFPKRFDVPKMLCFEGSYVFKFSNLPVRKPKGLALHPEGYAIARQYVPV